LTEKLPLKVVLFGSTQSAVNSVSWIFEIVFIYKSVFIIVVVVVIIVNNVLTE